MDFIGYVTKNSLAQALTYGPQADMEAWIEVNITIDPTTALYQTQTSDDVQRAMTDQLYFQSLVDAA